MLVQVADRSAPSASCSRERLGAKERAALALEPAGPYTMRRGRLLVAFAQIIFTEYSSNQYQCSVAEIVVRAARKQLRK